MNTLFICLLEQEKILLSYIGDEWLNLAKNTFGLQTIRSQTRMLKFCKYNNYNK